MTRESLAINRYLCRAGFVATGLRLTYESKSAIDDDVAAPLKETELMTNRVDDEGNLPQFAEEMAMNE